MKRYPLVVCMLFFNLSFAKGQVSKADTILATATQIADYILYQNHDSSYIRSYADKISLRILANNKYNSFRLWDQSLNSSIRYRPDLGVNFGIGASYKWLAFDIATSLGVREENISNSIYRDIQFRILTSKHYFRLRYQYYYGYKVDQVWGEIPSQLEDYEIRTDTRTMQFGIQYLYAFNYGKFSIKAPFAMNERQKKSAGSFVAGIGFLMYAIDADSSLIPDELELPSAAWNNFSQWNVVSLTANFGYMYSLILKERFFLTLGLIPGMGISNGDYWAGERTRMKSAFTLRLKTMNAIGYNGIRFFAGLQLIAGINYIPLEKELKGSIVEGKSALFVGYRF